MVYLVPLALNHPQQWLFNRVVEIREKMKFGSAGFGDIEQIQVSG